MKSLIIPTAKIVDKELQNIGELPPVIYPINDETVFDYIYNQYKKIVDEIDLICYEKTDLVRNKIKTYNDNKIKIVELNGLDSLGKTIYDCIKNIDNPIIINFGDTIVEDNFKSEEDAFFFSEEYLSSVWTYFTIENGILKNIYDKNLNEKKEKGMVFVGVFQIIHTNYFMKCLEESFNNQKHIGSFYLALQKYSEKYKLNAIKADNWFDVGHIDKYYNSKLEVKSREFNHIQIDKSRGILKKYSDDKEKFIGEIKWYLKMPSNLEYSRPRIFNYSLSYDNPFIEMEYYSYHTIHELFLYGDLSYKQWEDVFKRIKFICDDYSKYKVFELEKIMSSLKDMYLTKTISRINQLKDDKDFKIFFDNQIIINNIKYNSLNKIVEKLKCIIPKMLYNINYFNIIHGDLCFANIMIDNNLSFIKVIDPRGKFGSYDIYGDERYELAKLFHSVDGKYDYIIKDMFELNYWNEKIYFKLNKSQLQFDLYELLIKTFDIDEKRLKEIELIESLLFLSMIPLHKENLNHQYAMLATGIQILDKIIDIKEKNYG